MNIKRVKTYSASDILPRLFPGPFNTDRMYMEATCRMFGEDKTKIAIISEVYYNKGMDGAVFTMSQSSTIKYYDPQNKSWRKKKRFNTGPNHWLWWEVCPDLRWFGILCRNDKTRPLPGESEKHYDIRKRFYEELLSDFGL